MSHELRTPLNAIIGYSEILEEESQERGQAQFTTRISEIQGAGKHLLALYRWTFSTFQNRGG